MKKLIGISLIALSLPLVLWGVLTSNFTIMLLSDLVLWLGNVLFAAADVRRRLIFLIFNCVVLVFLLGRPMVLALQGDYWGVFGTNATRFALGSVYLTLLCICLGQSLGEGIQRAHPVRPPKDTGEYRAFLALLQNFALGLFFVSIACSLVMEGEKLIFMQGRHYEEYYVLFETQMPLLVRVFSGMMLPSLALFLATFPAKQKSFLPLCLYVVSTLPMLIIGQRNPAVQALLFVFLYYCLRDILGAPQKWMGRMEKALLILGAPFALFFLSMYNYLRADRLVSMSFFQSLLYLVYHQGVSFDVLARTHTVLPRLPGGRLYTLGAVVDYFSHSRFASIALGGDYLGAGASAAKALQSHRLTDIVAYLTLGDKYLQGHGWGTSYLLESYVDFGWLGIVVLSLLLGLLMAYMIPLIRRHWFLGTVLLMGLTGFFFLPRAETLGWVIGVITPHFWVAILFCYLGAQLCQKKYTLGSQATFAAWSQPLAPKK